jgi:hypothetical protein
MDAIERIAREAGAYESAVDHLAELVDQWDLTDREFRAAARRELEATQSRVAELRGES